MKLNKNLQKLSKLDSEQKTMLLQLGYIVAFNSYLAHQSKDSKSKRIKLIAHGIMAEGDLKEKSKILKYELNRIMNDEFYKLIESY